MLSDSLPSRASRSLMTHRQQLGIQCLAEGRFVSGVGCLSYACTTAITVDPAVVSCNPTSILLRLQPSSCDLNVKVRKQMNLIN